MADFSRSNLCGVDVAAATLDIAQADQPTSTIPNTHEAIRSHPVEVIGKELRGYMTAMKRIV